MKTSNLRRSAGITALLLSLTLTLSSCSLIGRGSDAYPKTSSYLYESFTKQGFLAPFKKDVPDLNTTMESMIGLSELGFDKTKQSKAISWLKTQPENLFGAGQFGEYIFAAHTLGFSDDPSVTNALTKMKKLIQPDYSLKKSVNFEYCWVLLALAAEGEKDLANQVGLKFTSLAEIDGAYRFFPGDTENGDQPNVTAFAVLSLQATKGFGTSEDEAAKTFAIGKARTWLLSDLKGSDHWISDGGDDMPGTAYAIMALHALGEDTSKYRAWYATQINSKDFGVIAPFTDPESDLVTTSQSILALNNLSFIDVINHMSK